MEIGLDDAYSVKTPEDNKKLYAKWADTYESEFVAKEGYRHPQVISEIFDREVPEVKTIIDIGTGTGLVGAHLIKLRNGIEIDGIDISPEMLEQARRKNIYRNLYERDLTQEVLGTQAPYDALITIGTFTHGHLGPEAIHNLLPLVKRAGHLAIGINASYFESQGFERFFGELLSDKKISELSIQKVDVYDEKSPHHESKNLIAVFRNLSASSY